MKKVLVLMIVLSMVSMAKASLKISVNGVIDPQDPIDFAPSQSMKIGICGNGATPLYIDLFLINEPMDKATMSGGVLLYPGTLSDLLFYEGMSEPHIAMLRGLGYNAVQAYHIELFDGTMPPAPLSGTLVDNINIHCDSVGDVTLTLMNLTGIQIGEDENDPLSWVYQITVYDTQVIHQISVIPEPMTMALLGLGGLFLRRNK